MNDVSASEDEERRIFDERIVPVVFPHPPADAPLLVFTVGQPGAGVARTSGALVDDQPIAELSANGLRAFHPRYRELSRARSLEAQHILAQSTTGWMRSALQHARTTGCSLALDGSLSSPDIALATTDLFAKSGFTTRVVVVATPPAESLLATVSGYLLEARAGRPATFTSVADHDAGTDNVRLLVQTLESSPSVDRLKIIGRDGVPRFNAAREDGTRFAGAGATLSRAHTTPLPAPAAMRWLSELRAVTDYAMSVRRLPQPLAEVLINLHEVALNEILPALPLPKDSEARPAAEARLGRQLVSIRQATRVTARPAPSPTPVITAPQPDRGISI